MEFWGTAEIGSISVCMFLDACFYPSVCLSVCLRVCVCICRGVQRLPQRRKMCQKLSGGGGTKISKLGGQGLNLVS